jgi:hypothetical protein
VAAFQDARYLIDQDINRFQRSARVLTGVGILLRAHMISRVRILGRDIEWFGGNRDDRALAWLRQSWLIEPTSSRPSACSRVPTTSG